MDAAPPYTLEYMDVDTDIASSRKRPREDRCEIRTQAADKGGNNAGGIKI